MAAASLYHAEVCVPTILSYPKVFIMKGKDAVAFWWSLSACIYMIVFSLLESTHARIAFLDCESS